MKRILKGLLLALVAISPAVADRSHNKTDLNIRVGRDSVPAFTTFHKMKADKNDDMIGGKVQATGFYAQSTNASHLARAFGADGTEYINVVTGTPATLKAIRDAKQVWNSLLLHDYNASGNALAGTIKFDPKQIVYGLRLDYFQRLDKWLDGLYFAANIPFVHIKNNLNMRVECDTSGLDSAEGVKLQDLLVGKTIDRTLAANAQDRLTCGKMCNNNRTGFGDLDLMVGWNFMEGRKYHMGINASLIVPTASEQKSEFLWGARSGDSKWGLGLGFDGSALLWEEGDQALKFLGSLQYKYLFDGTEKRTVGLNELIYNDGTKVNLLKNPLLSQYYLVGTVGSTGLKPLANLSTMDVKVKMRSQLDAILAFAYTNGGFTLDLGYNLFWKQAELVKCKAAKCKTTCTDPCANECGLVNNCTPACWDDAKYAVAHPNTYDSAVEFDIANVAHSFAGNTSGYIKGSQFDYDGAAAAAQLVHKACAGVGYEITEWEYPVMVGAGVAYEIPSNNKGTAAEGYSLWAKAGISF